MGTFARTFKEAQTYISPMMVLVIIPAVAATLPGFDLNAKLALIPILNVSLVCKDVLTANFPLGPHRAHVRIQLRVCVRGTGLCRAGIQAGVGVVQDVIVNIPYSPKPRNPFTLSPCHG